MATNETVPAPSKGTEFSFQREHSTEAAYQRLFTVWDLRSTDDRMTMRVAHPMHPDDFRFVHHYQRIVAQVAAFTPEEAVRLATAQEGMRR